MTRTVTTATPVAGNPNVVSLQTTDLDAPVAGAQAGTVPAAVRAYVTATEMGDPSGVVHATLLTFAALPITLRDTEQGKGVQVYTFPLGKLFRLGASGSVQVTTHSVLANTLHAGVTCQWGVGEVTQVNATLATTEQDILQNTAFTSSATVDVAPAASVGYGAPNATLLDGSSTPIPAFLNIAVAGAGDMTGNADVLVSGWVRISWLIV